MVGFLDLIESMIKVVKGREVSGPLAGFITLEAGCWRLDAGFISFVLSSFPFYLFLYSFFFFHFISSYYIFIFI